MNVVINNMTKIETEDMVDRCFDVVTATNRNIIVDCLSETNKTDILYVFDEVNNTLSGVPFSNADITKCNASIIKREKQLLTRYQAIEPTCCRLGSEGEWTIQPSRMLEFTTSIPTTSQIQIQS